MHTVVSSPSTSAAPAIPTKGELRPLDIRQVEILDGFWAERQALNSRAIIPHAVGWLDRLGWSGNLAQAATGHRFEHAGREFADSEVYKLIEAMSWDRARVGDASLHEALDRFIDLVADAQDPDGYLHTLFGRRWQAPRYSDFKWGHELYCFGHLIQAAVGHHRSTGEEKLLTVARRIADHVCVMFGDDGLQRVCGHAEIEMALVELYRETGERRYLDQAATFVERRGTGTLPLFEFGAEYWQDEMPVRTAEVLRGHAVRALYLASGAVDVAMETGDRELLEALERQWQSTVSRRTYITGGMGSHHMDEAFGLDFVLPPDRSYCETCAGVASIMFSWRLLLATGESKYADLIERTLFNIVATSPAHDGRSFFYANTLHQRTDHGEPALNEDGVVIRGGSSGRQPWFEVSCCPPNVARTLASLSAYVATTSPRGIQLHQYADARIETRTSEGPVVLMMSTDYPRSGAICVDVLEAPEEGVTVAVRVPEWSSTATFLVRGRSAVARAGYASAPNLVTGDRIVLELDMSVRVSQPDHRIDAVRGTAAIERGPEVFCLESTDLRDGWALDEALLVTDSATYDGETIQVQLQRNHAEPPRGWPYPRAEEDHASTDNFVTVPLVRYHSWAERGPSTMRVWIPRAD